MKQNEAARLAISLTSKFGLRLFATAVSELGRQCVLISPVDLHPNEAFQIKITIGWRSLLFELQFGKFAADLLYQMEISSREKRTIFASLIQEIISEKGIPIFKVNDVPTNPLDIDGWPDKWKELFLSLRKSPLEINTEDHALTESLINIWTERFLACVIAISPLEMVQEQLDELVGLPEGALTSISANRYERSRYNRTLCINFHGTKCKVCGMNFEDVFGQLGKGFIHVHHVTPVSMMGDNYIINPIKDLVPVCPNCHAMLHKRNPPYTVQELREILFSLNH
jgi:5-methylcytosine-specific restriction protein A